MVHETMKYFQTIKKELTILYFLPNQTDSTTFELIQQHWSCFLKSILSIISLFAYLIYVANTASEFMYSMFLSTASIFIFMAFTFTVFKTSALFNFLDHYEAVLNMNENGI